LAVCPQQKELRFLAKLNPEGHAASDRWIGQAEAGDWDALVEDLLVHHYDPSYAKAWVRNYSGGPSGGLIEVEVRPTCSLACGSRSEV
jgi:hypothetical protein